MYDRQERWDVRCEWGRAGLAALLPHSDVVIIVDVLVFSTCVELATSRGASVYPYGRCDGGEAAYATTRGALLANQDRRAGVYALAPTTLQDIPAGTRLVLPSSNGGMLSLATGNVPTLLGCLRNAHAVAEAAQRLGQRISVIAAGTHWADGTFRPAVEDLLGSGAIIAQLRGHKSPEAIIAAHAFTSAEATLPSLLSDCSSGRSVRHRGWAADIELSAQLNVSGCVPQRNGDVCRPVNEQRVMSR